MTEQELAKLKAEITAEVLEEMLQKKKSESVWAKAKKELDIKVRTTLTEYRSYQITDAISTIARRIFEKRTVVTFTEADIERINDMFDRILGIVEETKGT